MLCLQPEQHFWYPGSTVTTATELACTFKAEFTSHTCKFTSATVHLLSSYWISGKQLSIG